jgi:hypothetical protein
MGDEQIEVPFGDDPSQTATLLLAAAEELGLDQSVVGTQEGAFLVPPEVNDKAFKKPAKKAATKSAAKKKG